MKDKKVPAIRFKGFTGDWEKRKLGDVADVTKLAGFEFTEHIVYSDEGSIIALRGLNVKNGRLVLDDVKYIDGSNFSKLGRSRLDIDDVLFTYVGTVGELAIIPANERFYLAPNVARIRFQDGYNVQFMVQQMGSKLFYDNMIFPLIATSSQPALSMRNVRKFVVAVPKEGAEQYQIGTFFSDLDRLITLQQRKLEKLQNIKKSMLEKMFPKEGSSVPEIRFKGFTGDWEERELSSVFCRIGDGLHGTPKCSDSGDAYFINGNNLRDGHIVITDDTKRVDSVDLSDDDRGLDTNTFLYSINGTIGNMAWYTGEKIMLGKSAAYLTPKNFHRLFSYYLIQSESVFNHFLNNLTGTTIRNLGLKTIRDTPVVVPGASEQEGIGHFFKLLDDTITLQQQKLKKLQNVKKSMLEKMFI